MTNAKCQIKSKIQNTKGGHEGRRLKYIALRAIADPGSLLSSNTKEINLEK